MVKLSFCICELVTLPFKAWQKAEVIDFASRTNSKSEEPRIRIIKIMKSKKINGPTYGTYIEIVLPSL